LAKAISSIESSFKTLIEKLGQTEKPTNTPKTEVVQGGQNNSERGERSKNTQYVELRNTLFRLVQLKYHMENWSELPRKVDESRTKTQWVFDRVN
jgi:hypothetical protein